MVRDVAGTAQIGPADDVLHRQKLIVRKDHQTHWLQREVFLACRLVVSNAQNWAVADSGHWPVSKSSEPAIVREVTVSNRNFGAKEPGDYPTSGSAT